MNKSIKGLLFYLLHILIGVGNDIILKKFSLKISFFQIIFLRAFLGFMFLLFIGITINSKILKPKRIWLYILRGFLMSLILIFWSYSITKIPIAQVTSLSFTVPLFVLIMAPIFLREKISSKIWLATIICIISAIFTINPFSTQLNFDSLFVILASIFLAILDILTKIYINKENKLTVILYSGFFTSVFLLMPAYIYWKPILLRDYIILILLGLNGNFLIYALHKSLDYINVSMLAPYRFIEFVISSILGFFIFKEVPSISVIFTAIIIISTNIYIHRSIYLYKNE